MEHLVFRMAYPNSPAEEAPRPTCMTRLAASRLPKAMASLGYGYISWTDGPTRLSRDFDGGLLLTS